MADKNHLFSIGRLSKLTGVHVQSLRYYEEIGILKPAYVDPDSQYRYYTFQHVKIVEAIQFCVELDIPLKQFKDFLLETDGQIDYAKLMAHGTRLAEEKMKRIRKRLAFLKEVKNELAHAEECRVSPYVKRYFPERLCWTVPYEGIQRGTEFYGAFYRLMSDMEARGLPAGYYSGQFQICSGGQARSYLFLAIREREVKIMEDPRILRIPAGDYLCTVLKESGIHNAPAHFPELFSMNYDRTVVEVELWSEKFPYSEPFFELRCSLPGAEAP